MRTSKRGWAGEELEISHRNEQKPKDDYAAVNIKQFQNTEVGAGYQARGVVRQKTAGGEAPQSQHVRDMTHAVTGDSSERKRPKEAKEKGTTTKRKRLEEYMKCDGIREFRKEIEHLLASAKT